MARKKLIVVGPPFQLSIQGIVAGVGRLARRKMAVAVAWQTHYLWEALFPPACPLQNLSADRKGGRPHPAQSVRFAFSSDLAQCSTVETWSGQ